MSFSFFLYEGLEDFKRMSLFLIEFKSPCVIQGEYFVQYLSYFDLFKWKCFIVSCGMNFFMFVV